MPYLHVILIFGKKISFYNTMLKHLLCEIKIYYSFPIFATRDALGASSEVLKGFLSHVPASTSSSSLLAHKLRNVTG